MKDQLCKAFCDEIQIRTVPFGLAVCTGFDGFTGDPIGFYISKPDASGMYRIQDDGQTVFHLESVGADLDIQTRHEAFLSLLDEYGFKYDETEQVLQSDPLEEKEVPSKALRFVALLLRAQDLVLMIQERAQSTFKEEALRRIREKLQGRAEIFIDEPIDKSISDYPADVLIRADKRPPVAVFFGTSDKAVADAIITDLLARHEAKISCCFRWSVSME